MTAKSTMEDEFDIDALASVYKTLTDSGIEKELAHQIISAEATQAMMPMMVAEAVAAASSLAAAEAVELVVSQATK